MLHIMLVCSAGMSTSLLVTKMKEEADKRGIEAEIWAIPDAEVPLNYQKADVILLGPQIRFQLNKIKGEVGDTPIDVIDMRAYGAMNGAVALDQALKLAGK